LKTISPFPQGTRIILSMKTADLALRAGGVVRVAHPDLVWEWSYLQSTSRQHDQVRKIDRETLRANGQKSPELLVEPDGLEASSPSESSTDSSIPYRRRSPGTSFATSPNPG